MSVDRSLPPAQSLSQGPSTSVYNTNLMTSVMRPDPRYELALASQVPHIQIEHHDTSAVAVTHLDACYQRSVTTCLMSIPMKFASTVSFAHNKDENAATRPICAFERENAQNASSIPLVSIHTALPELAGLTEPTSKRREGKGRGWEERERKKDEKK